MTSQQTQDSELQAEKNSLIEKLGGYFEKEKQVAPMAARILAMLVLNGKAGTTFEQLVHDLGASKSTICTHLNGLEAQQWIVYVTKTGDRKKYYSMNPGYISRRIKLLTTQWNQEIELQKQIISYKSRLNKVHPEKACSIAAHENVLRFLTGSVAYFEKQMKEYQSNNKKNNLEEL